VYMYAYSPFSPHNGITTGNVFISLFLLINDNFKFSWNCYYTGCLILYFVC
jgi:hypothetical protein